MCVRHTDVTRRVNLVTSQSPLDLYILFSTSRKRVMECGKEACEIANIPSSRDPFQRLHTSKQLQSSIMRGRIHACHMRLHTSKQL